MIALEKVSKSFKEKTSRTLVLENICFSISSGDNCAITGHSGSGKSTLLNILGLLDPPEIGKYYLDGIDTTLCNSSELAALRNDKIGFVFQNFNLLDQYTALDNVAMPLTYRKNTLKEARQRALDIMSIMGVSELSKKSPALLSGGQRQRVAISRALISKPSIILADEPTGNLDQATAFKVFDLLIKLNRDENITLVIVTHDEHLADRMNRKIIIKNGSIV